MLYGKEYWRQCKPERSSLERLDIDRCKRAVGQFRERHDRPGLNFERLGSTDRQNRWSIRASRELRVILAVECAGGRRGGRPPKRFASVNMGHHDPTYAWAQRQDYYSDLDDSGAVCDWGGLRSSDRTDEPEDSAPPVRFEDWMLFPSKSQMWHIRRTHPAAARIRGAAGTGKTVIALHRAAHLGRWFPSERVLVTTFSRSLRNHMKAQFERLPDPPRNVDFINIDRLAVQFLGERPLFNRGQMQEAFEEAFKATVPEDVARRLTPKYLEDKISRVIKGRDEKRDEYLDTGRFERLGRIRSLKRRDREVCWRLRESWDRGMRERGIDSFEDCLIDARNQAWDAPSPMYRAAIIDEGQDMTLVGVQFVRALVAGRPENNLKYNGLLVLDDSAQRIYAGGYRPSWANLDFEGNSKTIHRNYRSSPQVLEAARAVRGDTVVGKDDNDGGTVKEVGFEQAEGQAPSLLTMRDGESPAILAEIQRLVTSEGFQYEEIGVLTRRNENVKALVEYLDRRSVPCVNLKVLREDEPLPGGVRVGTRDRAKGLEFRAVFVARLGKSLFPLEEGERWKAHQMVLGSEADSPPALTDEEREVSQLHLDRLYVATTRARERLYLVADEGTCSQIQRAAIHFRHIGSPTALLTGAGASV